MADIKEIKIGDEVYNVKDALLRKSSHRRSIGRTRMIYVDAVNGNDANDGKNDTRPIKTMAHCIELINHGDVYEQAQELDEASNFQVYLMGNAVYECPYYVICFTAPHFYAVPGSNPTLKFTYWRDEYMTDPTVTASNRFYSCHVNLTGQNPKEGSPLAPGRLKIDASLHSLYFESCACTWENVDFLCFIRVIGGSVISQNCSYKTDDNPNIFPRWVEIPRCAVTVSECNANFYNTIINVNEPTGRAMVIRASSLYESLKVLQLRAWQILLMYL